MRKLLALIGCLIPMFAMAQGPPFTLMVNRTNYHVAAPTNFWSSNIFAGTGITLAISNDGPYKLLYILNDNPTPGVGSVVVMSNGVPIVTNGYLNFLDGVNTTVRVVDSGPGSADVYIDATGSVGGGHSFNTNQFGSNATAISILNGAQVSNLIHYGLLTNIGYMGNTGTFTNTGDVLFGSALSVSGMVHGETGLETAGTADVQNIITPEAWILTATISNMIATNYAVTAILTNNGVFTNAGPVYLGGTLDITGRMTNRADLTVFNGNMLVDSNVLVTGVAQADHLTAFTMYVGNSTGSVLVGKIGLRTGQTNITNYVWTATNNYGWGHWQASSGNSLFTNANTVYLRKDGNDTTAVRGESTKPFATLSNAVAALQSGDTLLIYPGNYSSLLASNMCFATISNKHHVSVIGVGKPNLWMTNNFFGEGFRIVDSSNVTFQGLVLRGPSLWDPINNYHGASAFETYGTNVDSLRIEGCELYDWPGHGVTHDIDLFTGFERNLWVIGNYFYNIGRTNYTPESGTTIDGAAVSMICSGSIIANNIVEACARGFEIWYNEDPTIRGVFFAQNILLGVRGANLLNIAVDGALTPQIVFVDNIIYGWRTNAFAPDNWGINFQNAQSAIITGNSIENVLYDGISWSGKTNTMSGVVANNVIKNISLTGVNGAGIKIITGVNSSPTMRNIEVHDNVIENVASTGIELWGDGIDVYNNKLINVRTNSGGYAAAEGAAIWVRDTLSSGVVATNIAIHDNKVNDAITNPIVRTDTIVEIDSGASVRVYNNHAFQSYTAGLLDNRHATNANVILIGPATNDVLEMPLLTAYDSNEVYVVAFATNRNYRLKVGAIASGGTVSGDTVTVNDVPMAAGNADFDDDAIAAAEGVNVIWQTDQADISAYVPTNSSTSYGVVAPGVASKVWKTDGSGVPYWRDDATVAGGVDGLLTVLQTNRDPVGIGLTNLLFPLTATISPVISAEATNVNVTLNVYPLIGTGAFVKTVDATVTNFTISTNAVMPSQPFLADISSMGEFGIATNNSPWSNSLNTAAVMAFKSMGYTYNVVAGVQNPSDGQGPVFDTNSGRWVYRNLITTNVFLSGLNGITVTVSNDPGPTDRYNFVQLSARLTNLTDVGFATNPTSGLILGWNGSSWVPVADANSGGTPVTNHVVNRDGIATNLTVYSNFSFYGSGGGGIEIFDNDASESFLLLAPAALASNQVLTVPASTYTDGLFLMVTNGSNTVWASPPGGTGTPGGGDMTVQFNDGGVFAGTNDFKWDITNSALLLSGAAAGKLRLYDNDGVESITLLAPGVLGSNQVISYPANGYTDGKFLMVTNGSNTVWATPPGGTGTPAGDSGQIQFNTSDSFDASTNLTFNNTTKVLTLTNGTLDVASNIIVRQSGDATAGEIRLKGTNGANYAKIVVRSNQTYNTTFFTPTNDPLGAGNYLSTDGTFTYWIEPPAPGGASALSDLSDVQTGGDEAQYQILQHNGITWTNVASPTFSNAVYSLADSASNAPAGNEFPTAGWVRSLFMSGFTYYNSTNVTSFTNDSEGTPIYAFTTDIPFPGIRYYSNVVDNQYFGSVSTTNRFTYFSGPITVDSYIGRDTGASKSLTAKAEIYYSYDGTNWLGDWDCSAQTITGGTNLYQFVISVPATTSTNDTGFYVQRRFKVVDASETPNQPDVWIALGTNTPSHIQFAGPNSAAGNAYLANNQTFTGTNTFTKPVTLQGLVTATNLMPTNATYYHYLYVPAGAMLATTLSNATSGTHTNAYLVKRDTWAFDDSAAEYVTFATTLGDGWDLGTVKAKFHFLCNQTNVGSTNVTWGIRAAQTTNQTWLGANWGTAVLTNVPNSSLSTNDLVVSPASPALTVGGTLQKGYPVDFKVYRDAANAGDNQIGDALLLGVEIQYGVKFNNSIAW